ncbi:MAG: DUF1295 domain-containing protein [Candidatus Heimdallarchaeaceae archaeon]
MINELWYWVSLMIIATFLMIWLFFSIYRGIRYEMLQILGYIMIIISLAFSIGEYSAPSYFKVIAAILGYIAFIITLLSLLMANRRWVIRRGIQNLNKFSNLMIYAYARHPITLGAIIVSLSILFLNNSVLSNVMVIMAVVCFILSSIEKDIYYENLYGYPYTLYKSTVPRFNIILGIVKSGLAEKNEKEE